MQGEPTTTRRGFFCPDWREIGLWSAAGLVIVCIHAGAAWSLQNIQPDEPSSDIAAAVMIDMEPLPAPVAAQPVRQELPVEPEPANPEPVQQEAAAPEPLEQVQAEPEPQVQPLEEITPDQPEPDLAEAAAPEPEEAEPLDEQAEKLVELPRVEVPLPVVRPQADEGDGGCRQGRSAARGKTPASSLSQYFARRKGGLEFQGASPYCSLRAASESARQGKIGRFGCRRE